ncbi:MAG: 3-octaprenyl-4-hydroxybenzoate decarboxylase, partial [Betaproteobacteria bacterium]
MKYRDLREFLDGLDRIGELQRIEKPISTRLEMTALSNRVLRSGGPALLFEQPVGYKISVLTNLFGTPSRVAMAMGADEVNELREMGQMLASLKEPEPPRGLKDSGRLLQMVKALWDMKPRTVRSGPCQEQVREGREVD